MQSKAVDIFPSKPNCNHFSAPVDNLHVVFNCEDLNVWSKKKNSTLNVLIFEKNLSIYLTFIPCSLSLVLRVLSSRYFVQCLFFASFSPQSSGHLEILKKRQQRFIQSTPDNSNFQGNWKRLELSGVENKWPEIRKKTVFNVSYSCSVHFNLITE